MIQPTRRALLASLATVAVAGPARAKSGGSVSMVPLPEPARLQCAIDTGVPVQLVSAKMHDGLIGYDGSFDKPIPGLATSWEPSADGKSVTFKLRQGVKWHDGQPFTSADVKFTIEEVVKKYHSRGRAVYANVTVETPDDFTAVFHLAKPTPFLMSVLHPSETPMVPKHIYEVGDVLTNPANNAPIGTGPFKFKEWKHGSYILLERNPDYWQPGKPALDQVVFKIIPDSGARAVAFESGELDIGGPWPVSMIDLQRYQGGGKLKVTTEGYGPFATMDFFEFNLRDPLFQDVRVRQAIAHCIDKSFIVDTILFGFASAATGPVSKDMAHFYTDKVPLYPVDLKLAEKMLDEAGHKRGAGGVRFGFTLDPVPYGDRYSQMAEYIAQALDPVGIKVTIRQQDVASWLRRVYTTRDCQTYVYGIYNMMDPSIGVQRQYHSRSIQDGVVFSNGSGYRNPRVDEIFDQAQTEPDDAVRKKLFAELQVIIATDLPNIALVSEEPATVYNKRISNLESGLMGIYENFADISVTA